MNPARRTWRATWGPADYVAATYAFVYVVWVLTHTPGLPHNDLIGDLAFLPLGIVIASAFAANARAVARVGLDWRTQTGWWLLAGSAGLLWVSGTAWTWYVRSTGPTATPPWIDALEYCQLLCTLGASLMFPARQIPASDRARFGLDVALVFAAAAIVAVHYGTAVVAPWREAIGLNLVVFRAVLDCGVFFVLSVGTFHKRDRTARTVMAGLLAANVCVLAGNSVLSSLSVYRSGHPVDLLWFAAWGCKWFAARTAARQYAGGGTVAVPGASDAGTAHATWLPHTVVASVYALLLFHIATGRDESISPSVYAATGLTTLLVARQIVELRDNRRLFRAQLAAEARFRSIVQNVTDLVMVADIEGRLLYLSPSSRRLLGVEEGARFVDLVTPNDSDVVATLLRGDAGDAEQAMVSVRSGTGDWRQVDVVASTLPPGPEGTRTVLIGRDVTERNDLERRLHHAQRLDAVGQLAGGLAHDYNNALAAIRGYTELLQADVPPRSAAAVDLAFMAEAVDRAAAVTRKLLAFSRRQAVQAIVFDPNAVLRSLESMLRHVVTERVRLSLSFAPDLWPVRLDPGQFEQVLVNLATNARDAMPEGGTLDIRTVNLPAGESRPGGGDCVALYVRDSGTGMPPAVCERIFEPFFSTKPRDRGMGLGLAMVHGIVTQAGGHIDVDSTEGAGTTFLIVLPRAHGMPSTTVSASAPPSIAASGRRILVVDDEPGVRGVVRRMLERAGFEAVEADSGAAALMAMERADVPFDILLTDLVMPGMHGRELIARVRRTRPAMPVVCMTGYAGEPDASDVRTLEAGAILTKPFSADALVRALARVWPDARS